VSPDPAELPDRAAYRARWRALHGGTEPAASPAIAAWLTLVETVARPLARRNVPPDVLTALGVALAAAAPVGARSGGRGSLAAGATLAASGFADGLDGAVAVLSGAATPWGFVLDSLADRVSDAFALIALRSAGAPPPLPAAAAVGIALLEYARARAIGAGYREIGVVTVGERPVRVAVAAATLLAAGVFPRRARLLAAAGTAAIGGLSAAGSLQFLRIAAPHLRALSGSDQPGDARG
jgi:phosphatidylglycerophosphate synthase